MQVKTKKRQFKVGNLVILLSCLYFGLWITSTTSAFVQLLCEVEKKASLMLISQLKCDLLCRLSACFDLRALCRRRFCEGDVALVLSKKEKVISAHKQEKLITLKGKDAEKAAPGTD